jgi:uncharacterized NAD(P)/FAD-binding protein YdhS
MSSTRNELSRPFTVTIIGGGFTGATLAAQLLRRGDAALRVVVIERSQPAGRGVAYGTLFNWHLLNVPAGKMSMFPDEPEHFLRWAQRNYDRAVDGDSFVPRRVYGQYVGAILRVVESSSPGRLQWLHDEALTVDQRTGGAEIRLRSGERVVADKLVLALGNLPPGDPALPGLTAYSKHYVSYPWASTALEGVGGEKEVLLIGSGLTAVDIALALRAREFKGVIHVLSRRGLLAHPHKNGTPWPLFWDEASPRTARGLLHLVREQVNLAHQQGSDWRSVIDSLRPVTGEIWESLPIVERRRFLRHLRAHWEVRRHRLAPEVAKLFGHQIVEGKVRVHAGRILAYRETANAAEISYRERGKQSVEHLSVDRVINCTGPETDCRKLENVLLADLRRQGLVRPDPLFLGLDTAGNGAAIDRHGRPSTFLYVVGPARKGQLWEATAVPEIRGQVANLALQLLQKRPVPLVVDRRPSAHEATPAEARGV